MALIIRRTIPIGAIDKFTPPPPLYTIFVRGRFARKYAKVILIFHVLICWPRTVFKGKLVLHVKSSSL